MRYRILLVFLIGVLFSAAAEAQEWYALEDNELYVTDFVLAAGQSEEFSVYADGPVKVGFKTDVNFAENSFELYSELSEQYGDEVIQFSDIYNGMAVSTVSGGSLQCKPTDGTVDIEITNMADRDFEVVIYMQE